MLQVNERYDFVKESNRIEGILREPMPNEVRAFQEFMALPKAPTIGDLEKYIRNIQPNAKLRILGGMDVIVGRHIPPKGGPDIKVRLQELLDGLEERSPFENHILYETLHPFTDGNGRSGRALWAWQMSKLGRSLRLGFLHTYYYQSLDESRVNSGL